MTTTDQTTTSTCPSWCDVPPTDPEHGPGIPFHAGTIRTDPAGLVGVDLEEDEDGSRVWVWVDGSRTERPLPADPAALRAAARVLFAAADRLAAIQGGQR